MRMERRSTAGTARTMAIPAAPVVETAPVADDLTAVAAVLGAWLEGYFERYDR